MDSSDDDEFDEFDEFDESGPYAAGHSGAQSYFKAQKGGQRTSSRNLSGIQLPGHAVSGYKLYLPLLTQKNTGSCIDAA